METSLSASLDNCEAVPENEESNTTYYSISVEEVSLVKRQQPDHWTNRRVRVIGMMKDLNESHLKSVMEEGGPYSIRLDLSYLEKSVPLNSVIQVFGVVKIDMHTDTPYIAVRFFRDMGDVDIQALRDVTDLQRKYVPQQL